MASATETSVLASPEKVTRKLDDLSLQPGVGVEESVISSSHLTRSVAVIKHHALEHRLDIEQHISEAGFEIIKERQMGIDVESDPDTAVELFGPDAHSFAEGPVWVYILEAPNAVKAWSDLMGPSDPTLAKETAPMSLRARYGTSESQNALMGSADDNAADIQIASLFASSPPFPSVALPGDSAGPFTDASESASAPPRPRVVTAAASVAAAARKASLTGKTPTSASAATGTKATASFRARPAPSSTRAPTIVPRTTRSSALRAGILPASAPDLPHTKSGPRVPLARERLAQTFADVPGHGFRSERISVGSTRPPAIAPRMTKAASLRLGSQGGGASAPIRPRASTGSIPRSVSVPLVPRASLLPGTKPPVKGTAAEATDESGEAPVRKPTYEGVPGHKRSETIAVASTRAPSIAPRLNKATQLRHEKEGSAPPPSSFMFRSPSSQNVPGSRTSSRTSMHAPRPSLSRAPSNTSIGSSASVSVARRIGGHVKSASLAPPSSFRGGLSRSPSVSSGLSSGLTTNSGDSASQPTSPLEAHAAGEDTPKPAPAKAARRLSSTAPPAVVPRQNRAATLRAAKMEAEAKARAEQALKAAKAAAKAKPTRRQSVAV